MNETLLVAAFKASFLVLRSFLKHTPVTNSIYDVDN